MSHVVEVVGISFLHLPLSERVGPLKSILQLSADMLL